MQHLLVTAPFFFSTLTAAALVWAALRRPPTGVSRAFAALMAITTVWCGLWFIGTLVPDLATKFYVANMRVAFASLLAPTVLILERRIAGGRPLSWRQLVLLFSDPAISFPMALLSPHHNLFLRNPRVAPGTGLLVTDYGPWFSAHILFSYTLMVLITGHLVLALARARPPHRERLWLALAVPLPTTLGDLVFLLGMSPLPGYSLSPAFVGLSGLLFYFLLLRYPYLELAPLARLEVVDMVGEVMFVVDRQGRLADINLAGRKLFNIKRSERIGLPATGLFPGIEKLIAEESDREAVLSDLPLTIDGHQLVFEAHASPLKIEGDIRGRVFVMHDVTAQRQRERETQEHARRLEEVDRLKDGFVSTVSHELRTPLSSILGLSEVVLDEPLSPDVRRHIVSIQRSGNLLLALVNDILDLSKVKSGKIQIESIPCHPRTIIEEVLEGMMPVADAKGLGLDWYCPAGTGPFMTDPTRLRQILVNLVGNALKFTAAGTVQVVAQRSGPFLTLRVIDTGPGVPPEKREMIFDEFTQMDARTTREYGGTGLGLPISRRLARLLGGDVTVEENPTGGSVFVATVASRQTDHAARPSREATKGSLFLLASAPLRSRTLAEALDQLGYDVTIVDSWEIIVGRCRAEAPPALIWIAVPGFTPARLEALRDRENRPLSVPTVIESRSSDQKTETASGQCLLMRGPVWTRELPEVLGRLHAPQPEEVAPRAPLSVVSGPRVLVADDVTENRDVIAAYVRKEALQVEFATNGKEALEKFRTGVFDLVFLDIEMPVMDGYEAARAMRGWEKERGLASTPLLAMTAHGNPEHIAATALAGFSHHLTKPLAKKNFLNEIEQFAEASPHRTVEPDEAISEMAEKYVLSLTEQLDWLRARADDTDQTRLREFGHKVAGTAGSLGLLQLGFVGRGLEAAAKGAPALVPELVEAMVREITTAQQTFEEAARLRAAS